MTVPVSIAIDVVALCVLWFFNPARKRQAAVFRREEGSSYVEARRGELQDESESKDGGREIVYGGALYPYERRFAPSRTRLRSPANVLDSVRGVPCPVRDASDSKSGAADGPHVLGRSTVDGISAGERNRKLKGAKVAYLVG